MCERLFILDRLKLKNCSKCMTNDSNKLLLKQPPLNRIYISEVPSTKMPAAETVTTHTLAP